MGFDLNNLEKNKTPNFDLYFWEFLDKTCLIFFNKPRNRMEIPLFPVKGVYRGLQETRKNMGLFMGKWIIWSNLKKENKPSYHLFHTP